MCDSNSRWIFCKKGWTTFWSTSAHDKSTGHMYIYILIYHLHLSKKESWNQTQDAPWAAQSQVKVMNVWEELQERFPPNLRSKEIALYPALVPKASEEDVVASRENGWEHSSGARIGVEGVVHGSVYGYATCGKSRCFFDIWLFHSPRCLVGWPIRIGYLMNESKTEQELDILLTNNFNLWVKNQSSLRGPSPFSKSTRLRPNLGNGSDFSGERPFRIPSKITARSGEKAGVDSVLFVWKKDSSPNILLVYLLPWN